MPVTYNYKIRGLSSVTNILNGPSKREPAHNMIFQKDVVIGGSLYVGNVALMKIQPNIVIRGNLGDNVTLWAKNTSGSFIMTDIVMTNPPTDLARNIMVTKTSGVSNKADILWFEFYDRPLDLSFMDYMGFFYRGKASASYAVDDITVLFFEDSGSLNPSNLNRDYACQEFNFVEEAFTEGASNSWKYSEIRLPANREKRRAVKAVGFYVGELANGITFEFNRLEFYKIGTKHGPVRGTMVSLPIAPNYQISAGDLVIMDSNGYVKTASGSDDTFVGKVVRDTDYGFEGMSYSYGYSHGYEKYINIVVDGIINNPFATGATVTAGNGVATASVTEVSKASGTDPQTHIGVAMKDVPTQGGTYPVMIGSRGFVGTL